AGGRGGGGRGRGGRGRGGRRLAGGRCGGGRGRGRGRPRGGAALRLRIAGREQQVADVHDLALGAVLHAIAVTRVRSEAELESHEGAGAGVGRRHVEGGGVPNRRGLDGEPPEVRLRDDDELHGTLFARRVGIGEAPGADRGPEGLAVASRPLRQAEGLRARRTAISNERQDGAARAAGLGWI